MGNSSPAAAASGENRFTEDVTRTLAQLPTVVQTLTGLDMAEALRRIARQDAPANAAAAAST